MSVCIYFYCKAPLSTLYVEYSALYKLIIMIIIIIKYQHIDITNICLSDYDLQ